jgi:hypothetical protein
MLSLGFANPVPWQPRGRSTPSAGLDWGFMPPANHSRPPTGPEVPVGMGRYDTGVCGSAHPGEGDVQQDQALRNYRE